MRMRPSSPSRLLARFARNKDGTTAVEFGLIAVPFIMLLLGSMSICLYFFATLYTEQAVWGAARDLRTNALQQSTGAYSGMTTDKQKVDALRKAVCDRTPQASTDCLAQMLVMVDSFADGAAIPRPSCTDATDSSKMRTQASADTEFSPGNADQVVLVTACWPWKLGSMLPFITLSNVSDGGKPAFLIQASALIRTEP